ncbi:MAG: hypothetical protein JWM38_1270 [Sphingomonas bacterium]|jgi:hypothetical protein|nr:hypothetical protein [Sphingomonas bacterium]MDB5717843.1 hypothetical protein [Sphingomonas bacterium]
MSDRAAEFLTQWCLKRENREAISREEAARVAARWEEEAAENGIPRSELERAAEGPIADFLIRTYGDAGTPIDGETLGSDLPRTRA